MNGISTQTIPRCVESLPGKIGTKSLRDAWPPALREATVSIGDFEITELTVKSYGAKLCERVNDLDSVRSPFHSCHCDDEIIPRPGCT